MLGRAAYHQPALLGAADRRLFADPDGDVSEHAAVERYLPYVRSELAGARPWRL